MSNTQTMSLEKGSANSRSDIRAADGVRGRFQLMQEVRKSVTRRLAGGRSDVTRLAYIYHHTSDRPTEECT